MMLTKGTCVKTVAVCLLAVTARYIFQLIVICGVFSHQYNHYPGPCRKVNNMQLGSEDFETLSDGLTFITSGFREHILHPYIEERNREKGIKGRIFLLDLKNPDNGVKELKMASTDQFNVDTFNPLGISALEDEKTGRHVMFVVNHVLVEAAADRIEKFIYNPDKQELVHLASYSGDAMKMLNGVQATGENSFYFTNFVHFHGRYAYELELLLMLRSGDAVFFDGTSYTVVADDMLTPDGIIMSKDGRYVYIAVFAGKEIRAYRRNKDNSLTLQQVLPLQTSPDNFQIDHTTGHLYIGSHPILYKTYQQNNRPDLPEAHSQVLQLRVDHGNITSVQELFYDQGDLISGSAVATVYDRKLLIGSVYHDLVICDVNTPL